MARRRSRSAAVLLVTAALLAACGGDDAGEDDGATATERATTIGLVLEAGGGADLALGAAIERAETDFGLEVQALEPSRDGSDRGELLELLVADGVDVVIALGAGAQAAVEGVAAEHPDVPFAVIGGTDPVAPNVTSIRLRTEHAAYLAGAVAALTSPAKHVGFVGGVPDEPTQAVQAGFTAGALRVDRATEVEVAYLPAGAGADTALLMGLAAAQYDAGAEVVIGVPRGIDDAVFAAAAQRVPPARAIGVEADRADVLDPALRPVVVTWAVTHLDVALREVIEAFVAGRLDPGVRVLGLEEGAVGIATDGLPPDVVTQVEDLTEGLVAGEIPVPTTP